jgi:guanylate kinase
MVDTMAKLIILSGPSCVGKSPLVKALKKFHPQLMHGLEKLILYNSRAPRPGEADGVEYHFRRREILLDFNKDPKYLVMDIRGDLQGIDLSKLGEDLQSKTLFFEGNPIIIDKLLESESMKGVELLSIFLSPLSGEEIKYLESKSDVDLQLLITDIMRRKLLRRTQKQKMNLSLFDLQEVERRANSAISEMAYAYKFDYVVANHDGEDSDNWDAVYYPLGDARKTIECVASLLGGCAHPAAEQWDERMLQGYRKNI